MGKLNDGISRDSQGRRLTWIICEACGKRVLARIGKQPPRFCSRSCAKTGKFHPAWKGNEADYSSMHWRVRRLRGSADHCERCGRSGPGTSYEWASLTRNYGDIWDYEQMCKACHVAYDRQIGSGHWCAKLTEEIVAEARRRYAAGESQGALAREFGVARPTMAQAIVGRTWKNVP